MKTIKRFICRLSSAWSILKGCNVIHINFDEDVSKEEALRSTVFLTGVQWLKSNDDVDTSSRSDMLLVLLGSDNSVMLLAKDADGKLTYCYDCKSEEDFNDLVNMKIE